MDEPIIDAARIPLSAYGKGRSRSRSIAMFTWLRIIRPMLTLAVWTVAAWFAWPYVKGAPARPEVQDLLVLYAFILSFILIFMLIIAPLRWLKQLREAPPRDEGEPSSLFALASFLHVPPSRLSAWQRARQLIVHHSPSGLLDGAAESGRSGKAPVLPLPEPQRLQG